MIDFKVDDKGDLVVDPYTHDLVLVDGLDEIVQRIKATLRIRYGEMERLAPDWGSDYTNFLGKNYNKELASADISAALTAQVPEVVSVDDVEFDTQGRSLSLHFVCTVKDDNDEEQTVEGGLDIGD